ncbi:MAG: TonB-dependent siderophore receptor [Nostoc sp.]|uniref:TonB-dependent siderophore receptor n=1 Tax=Nostoc sp. TaxID=1180 RepID=UPI002FF69E85
MRNQLQQVVLMLSALLVLGVGTVRAETVKKNIPSIRQVKLPLTSAEMLVQLAALEVVQVTGVKANHTNKGVEVILQTSVGEQLQIINRSTGNNFIADIPNAQLRLPNGEAFTFRSDKPIAGITEIDVTNFDANTIRVTVIGEGAIPTVELFDSANEGLIFSVASAAAASQPQTPPTPQPNQPENQTQPTQPSTGDEPIELVVTGEQDGYSVPDASTATKTDTPLRDIPQSIQVVPQQVLKDQQITRLDDALRNVSGVTSADASYRIDNSFTIRGFYTNNGTGNVLRNGLRDPLGMTSLELSNIERIEVLKGPGSVLFGQGTPGGTINLITKQPLRDPFYSVEATIGSYDFYRGAVDLSEPLNDSKTVLYRLNTSYRDSGSFVDFTDYKNLLIAPVLSWAISPRTNLTLEGEYIDAEYDGSPTGLPAIGTVLPNPNGKIPRNRNISNPSARIDQTVSRVGYTLSHKFSDNWSLRNAFRVSSYRDDGNGGFYTTSLADDNRTLNLGSTLSGSQIYINTYDLTTYIDGKFSTGSLKHQLVFGLDLDRYDFFRFRYSVGSSAQLDLFNPVYPSQPAGPAIFSGDTSTLADTLGVYVQDQVALAENLKLLLGGRFDIFKQTDEDFVANTKTSQSDDAFSPRVGIVYQPIVPISLYASYSRSFTPNTGTPFGGGSFQPERGTQYEVGVKADLSDQLSATLAFYNLTRSNVLTTDTRPGVPPGFSLQTGEQRSRGIELNIAGQILPEWNIIAGYAYTDAEITKDNDPNLEGNFLNNVPKHSFNLWTTYKIQRGSLQGFGGGVGFFFVGDRQGDLANTFEVPSYFRTDAAIFYKRNNFRAALNFRNLFNVDYFESAQSTLRVYPGEPFTVQGTISWEF